QRRFTATKETGKSARQFRVGRGNFDVLLRPATNAILLCFGKFANDPGRRTQHQRAGWCLETLGDERIRPDDAAIAAFRAVEDGRAHPDQTLVADVACVNDRAVADRRVVAHSHAVVVGQVHHREVLEVGALADDDRIDVAAQHAAVPHAALRAERYVAEYG